MENFINKNANFFQAGQGGNPLTVLRYKDNPDGTTTNFLSDGSQDTGRYTQNKDGSLNFNPINTTQGVKMPANVLNSDQISNVPTLNITPMKPMSNPSAFVGSLPNTDPMEQRQTEIQTRIDELTSQLGGQSQDVTDLQRSAGLPQQSQQLADANLKLAQMKKQFDLAELQASQSGETLGFAQGRAMQVRQQAAIEVGAQAAYVQALQGNIETANKIIETTIAQKYEPIQNQLDALVTNLENNYKNLTRADQKKADEKLAEYRNAQLEIDRARLNETIRANKQNEVVASGGNVVSTLTPEQQADPLIVKFANSAGGKPMTDTSIQKIDKGLGVLGQLGLLQQNIKDTKTGPLAGAFRGANPWDTNAQTIKAQLNAIVPNLARGVYGEVGVLTDNDIKTYSQTLPNLKSTEDLRNAVLGITIDLVSKSIARTLEVNAANGKDVSGFIDLYTEMNATRDSIFSQIPGYKPQGSSQATQQQSLSVDDAYAEYLKVAQPTQPKQQTRNTTPSMLPDFSNYKPLDIGTLFK